jgi:hypothetical protein
MIGTPSVFTHYWYIDSSVKVACLLGIIAVSLSHSGCFRLNLSFSPDITVLIDLCNIARGRRFLQ